MRGGYRSTPGQGKRQKELRRAERQEAKAERRAQRRGEKHPAADEPATTPSEFRDLAQQYRDLAGVEDPDQRADRLKMAEYLESRAKELEETPDPGKAADGG